MSSIEWTGKTWNPTIGCTPVSPGCLNCYAAKEAYRFRSNPNSKDYHDLTANGETVAIAERRGGRAVFTGDVRLLPDRLEIPLRRKLSTTWFVDSMSDLFHDDVPFEFIDRVFAVMALCPQHTFQILTKRPVRMAEYFDEPHRHEALTYAADMNFDGGTEQGLPDLPLPNVWLGTSAEDQPALNRRVPHLLRCPAAVRFVSCEPLIEPLDFGKIRLIGLDWIIVGGESGPAARACDVGWIRSVVNQCRDSGTPVFVKQLGGYVRDDLGDADDWLGASYDVDGCDVRYRLNDKKGGDPAEWPEDLRVRELPTKAVS
jgi:protein gp37